MSYLLTLIGFLIPHLAHPTRMWHQGIPLDQGTSSPRNVWYASPNPLEPACDLDVCSIYPLNSGPLLTLVLTM